MWFNTLFLWIFLLLYKCSPKSNTNLGPKFYRQLASSMWRPFSGRTTVSSWLVTISFWRSTRWDRSQGRRSILKKKTSVASPWFLKKLFGGKRCNNIVLNMFIYTESYTESNRHTQNINIYHKPHQHFHISHIFKKTYFQIIDIQSNQRFMLDFMSLLISYIIQQ